MVKRNIFVSSTVYDLSDERNAIKHFFDSASNEHVKFNAVMSDHPESFKMQVADFTKNHSYQTCLDKISLCSYYLLIINKRYNLRKEFGDSISITHREYREARNNKYLPCIVFVKKDTMDARHQYKKTGTQDVISDNQLQIFDFIDEITSQLNANWIITYSDPKDLVFLVSNILFSFDDSVFISEYPADGKIVEFYEEFTHTWVIKNNGNLVWKDRHLKCDNYDVIKLKATSNIIEIPTTYPGEEVHLTAQFKASGVPGVYESYWKMVDYDGHYCFPDMRGLAVHVKVVPSRGRAF